MEWISRDERHRLLCGDVREMLRTLPAGSVHCCVTSPPYWGLRDYGTAKWEGGDAACDHIEKRGTVLGGPTSGLKRDGRSEESRLATVTIAGDSPAHKIQYRDTCGKCGAVRIDRQIGQESTPEEYVATMVDVFLEVRRVLHDSGTVWLNVGDSYNAAGRVGHGTRVGYKQQTNRASANGCDNVRPSDPALKEKDLCLIPWRLAIALQADGWYVRSVICWAKKSPMPESVTDRPTNSWEPVFLLAKRARYFHDAEAVKERSEQPGRVREDTIGGVSWNNRQQHSEGGVVSGYQTRNQRNVWHLGPEPFPEAHFATFPSEIPRRAILAGTSHEGCCPLCGEPWRRVVEREFHRQDDVSPEKGIRGAENQKPMDESNGWQGVPRGMTSTRTLGFEPACTCPAATPVPCTVLDPFAGSGTVGMVAAQLARRSIGIELKPTYWQMAADRITQETQQPLLF